MIKSTPFPLFYSSFCLSGPPPLDLYVCELQHGYAGARAHVVRRVEGVAFRDVELLWAQLWEVPLGMRPRARPRAARPDARLRALEAIRDPGSPLEEALVGRPRWPWLDLLCAPTRGMCARPDPSDEGPAAVHVISGDADSARPRVPYVPLRGGEPTIVECSCGRFWVPDAWRCLPVVGLQDCGDGRWAELRNCVCMSTRAAELASDGDPYVF